MLLPLLLVPQDAAATFDIVSALKKWTRVMRGSAMVALLQPAPEVFDMFDQLILLRHGHMVFQGTQQELRDHLAACHITPNPNVDFADWILSFLSDPPTIWKRDLQAAHRGEQSAMHSFRESMRLEAATETNGAAKLAKAKSVETPMALKDVHLGGGSHHHHAHSRHPSSADDFEPQIVRIHMGDDEERSENGSDSDEWGRQPGDVMLPVMSPPLEEAAGTAGPAAGKTVSIATPSMPPRQKGLGRIISSKLVPLSTGALKKVYESSRFHSDLQVEIAERKRASLEKAAEAKLLPKSDFTRAQFFKQQSRGLWHHTKTCLWRQNAFMLRSTTFVGPRIFQAIFMGLVAGSLFSGVQQGLTDYTPRMGLIIFSMTFISLINMSEIPLASQFKLVIYKQVDAGFYVGSHRHTHTHAREQGKQAATGQRAESLTRFSLSFFSFPPFPRVPSVTCSASSCVTCRWRSSKSSSTRRRCSTCATRVTAPSGGSSSSSCSASTCSCRSPSDRSPTASRTPTSPHSSPAR